MSKISFYLVQHAEAKSEEEDKERRLTEKGKKEAESLAKFLRGKIKPQKIIHSGKARAMETALIYAEQLGVNDVGKGENLAPLDDPSFWAERLKKESSSLMLVGHLPHLSKLLSLLVAGSAEKEIVKFKHACCVALFRENEKFIVEWILNPEIASL